MIITDGTRVAEIEIRNWDGTNLGPDMSNDIFAIGQYAYDDATNCYRVPNDVQDFIDYAYEWANEENGMNEYDSDKINNGVLVFVS